MRHQHPLNAARRRARKEQLARRHGQCCGYCRRPFASLREATLDHIAPCSLWRTWSVTALMLACFDCNQNKADRFPLSLALMLCATFTPTGVNDPSTPVDAGSTPVDAGSTPVDRPVDGLTVHVDTSTVHVDGPVLTAAHGVFMEPFTLAVWRLLARLAHAHQPAFAAVWSPDSTDGRSTPDRRESTCHGRRERRPSARPNCLRAPRPVRTCAGPTGEAVPA
ncbi:HNH endonuclease [Streptomyces ipomoeae]|uniref:HNH endonuclease n=1 Tax=Streptomyces ipomoeae TaxID=103232 RepID=UPI00215C67AB|nr:HNH endonuclease [Streptomyces ipomoeae]